MTPQDIATALNIPLQGVAANWPQVLSALVQEKINTHPVRIATAATILTEVGGGFGPIPEYGTGDEYNGRADLGNVNPGDGPRYKGRGYIQLTGRANYRTYGQRLGLDLEGNPDLALDPHVAALVLALYFVDRGIPAMAAVGNWLGVRRAVNGGTNGLQTFLWAVGQLETLNDPDGHPVTTLTVNAALKAKPDHLGPPTDHVVAQLKAGATLTFTGNVTPHWAEATIQTGTTQDGKQAKGLKGWLLRESLRTDYVV